MFLIPRNLPNRILHIKIFFCEDYKIITLIFNIQFLCYKRVFPHFNTSLLC